MTERDKNKLHPVIAWGLHKLPHMAEFERFLDVFNRETERGAALVACGFIDNLLKQILLEFFVQETEGERLVNGFNAPLGTLSTRSSACYSFGLLSKDEFDTITLMRKVRNKFAHSTHTTFDDSDVITHCSNLTLNLPLFKSPITDQRQRFTLAAISLITRLISRADHVKQRRCSYYDWPQDPPIAPATPSG